MHKLLIWFWVLVVVWGQNVYYSPLSTQCPDTSRPSPVLHHNDIFLYDHDIIGDFPDIKRAVKRLHSAHSIYERSTDHQSNLGSHSSRTEPVPPDSLSPSEKVRERMQARTESIGAQSAHSRAGVTRDHILSDSESSGSSFGRTKSRDPKLRRNVPHWNEYTKAKNLMTNSKEANLTEEGIFADKNSQRSTDSNSEHIDLSYGVQHKSDDSDSYQSPLFDNPNSHTVTDGSENLASGGLSGVNPYHEGRFKNRAQSLAESAVADTNINWLKHKPPASQRAQRRRVNEQDSRSPTHFISQSTHFAKLRQPRKLSKLLRIGSPEANSVLSAQPTANSEVHASLNAKYSRRSVQIDFIQSTLAPYIQIYPLSQSDNPLDTHSERNSRVISAERLPSVDLLKRPKDSIEESSSERLQTLRTQGRQRQPNSQYLNMLIDIQKGNPTLWSILNEVISRQEPWARNNTNSLVSALLYCLGRYPSYLNKTPPVRPMQRPSAAHQDVSQKQTASDHSHSKRKHLDQKDTALNDVSDGTRLGTPHSQLDRTISNIIEFARAYKNIMLENNIQQHPEIRKRLSFIHPNCLDGKLDFVKSTTNIDADILQFLKEMTGGLANSSHINATRSMTRQKRLAQSIKFQLQTMADLFSKERNLLSVQGMSTSKHTVHRSDDQLPLASWTLNEHRRSASVRQAYDKAFLTRVGWKYSGSSSSSTKSRSSSSSDGGAARTEKRTHVYSRQSGPVQQRFQPGSPLPWSCPSTTRWRDLGMHVFPRYVQETSCGEDGDASSYNEHMPPTCWYGFYHCRPTTSALQVLVRHTGSCNDSRVPQNMRRYYFLSIVSINTGCKCV